MCQYANANATKWKWIKKNGFVFVACDFSKMGFCEKKQFRVLRLRLFDDGFCGILKFLHALTAWQLLSNGNPFVWLMAARPRIINERCTWQWRNFCTKSIFMKSFFILYRCQLRRLMMLLLGFWCHIIVCNFRKKRIFQSQQFIQCECGRGPA